MMRELVKALYELAQKDKNVIWLSADSGGEFDILFYRDFPNQYFNVGIAEENMIGIASGLSSYGMVPYGSSSSSFLAYRAFEFIRDDICFQQKNVKIYGFASGVSFSRLGPTHHATEDISILRTLPHLTILSPASPKEAYKCVHASYDINGPVYIRLEMANEPEIYEKDYDFKLSKNVIIKKGKDAAVFSTGSIINEVIQACVRLEKLGISVEIINVHTIKPFDRENLIYEASNHKYLFSIEEHSIIGGLGGLISEILIEENIMTKFKRIGLVDCFAKGYGTQQEVRKMNSLDADSIYSIIEKAVK